MVFDPIPDHCRQSLALGLILILGAVAIPAQAPSSQPPAPASAQPAKTPSSDWMVRDVLASLTRFDQDGRNPANKVSFELPEKAVNDYLVYALHEHPRPRISAITVTLLPGNQVSLSVEVD